MIKNIGLSESEPVCTPNTTEPVMVGETVSYTCEVQYDGNIYPQMQWSCTLSSIDDVIDESVDGELTKTTINVEVKKTDNGRTYNCVTFFNNYTPQQPEDATNKPTNEYEYESDPLVVQCKSRIVDFKL